MKTKYGKVKILKQRVADELQTELDAYIALSKTNMGAVAPEYFKGAIQVIKTLANYLHVELEDRDI